MSRFGRISLLDRSEGVGEIIDEHEQEICFHVKDIGMLLAIGSSVWFDIEMGTDGLRAVNILPIK